MLFREVTDCLGKKIKLYALGICVLKGEHRSWKACEDLLPCIHNIAFQLVRQQKTLSPHLTGNLPEKDEFRNNVL